MGTSSTERDGRRISQFFVYGLGSSGGHSPWHHPIGVYSRKQNRFARVDVLIGSPIISDEFKFTGPHTLTATTWGEEGQPGPVNETLDRPMLTIPIDLEKPFEKLPPE